MNWLREYDWGGSGFIFLEDFLAHPIGKKLWDTSRIWLECFYPSHLTQEHLCAPQIVLKNVALEKEVWDDLLNLKCFSLFSLSPVHAGIDCRKLIQPETQMRNLVSPRLKKTRHALP